MGPDIRNIDGRDGVGALNRAGDSRGNCRASAVDKSTEAGGSYLHRSVEEGRPASVRPEGPKSARARTQRPDTRADLPQHEAERLLAVATGRSRSQLISGDDISDAEVDRFRRLVERRTSGEPLQYLEGTVQFGPVTLRIDERALIPRPETEQLYERVSGILSASSPRVIVDIATGSGNLALALKHDFPQARVLGSDIEVHAISLARENSLVTGLSVEWFVGDLFDPLPADLRGRVDAVVANPPYVSVGIPLPSDVAEHEPGSALFAGEDGLAVLRRIAGRVGEWLGPRGLIACEIGADQGDAVRELFGACELFGAYEPDIEVDLSGRDRWIIGRRQRGVNREP